MTNIFVFKSQVASPKKEGSPEKGKAVRTSRETVNDNVPAAKRTLAVDDDSVSSVEMTLPREEGQEDVPMEESQEEVEYGKCSQCGTIGMRHTECRYCEDQGFLHDEKLSLKDRLRMLQQSKKVARVIIRPRDRPPVSVPMGPDYMKRAFEKLHRQDQKMQKIMAKRQEEDKEKAAAAKSRKNKVKIANYENGRTDSNNNKRKKKASGAKAKNNKKLKAKQPTPVDSEDTESDEDVPVA